MQHKPWRILMRTAALRVLWALAMLAAPCPALADPPERPGAPRLTLLVGADGRLEGAGILPRGLDAAALRRLLPGLDITAATAPDGTPVPQTADRWRHAMNALNIVLPRIGTARIVLCDRRLSLSGQLRPGFAIRETRPALRAALGPDWQLDFALREVPPPASLALDWAQGRLALTGILPAGLSVRQARLALGIPREAVADGGSSGLATGGDGDPAAWARALTALGRALSLHDEAEARLDPDGLSLSGQLRPGQTSAALERWLTARLGPDWPVSLDSAEAEASPGAIRQDPATGLRERLMLGYWIPVHDFPPEPAACSRMTAAAMTRGRLSFASGQSIPDKAAGRLLDRLAGVARHCIAAGLNLTIAGHTDSKGSTEANRALSEARADAVRAALIDRGVPERAIRTAGHGADRPLASNDEAAGRLLNRRITFDWTGG